MGRGNGLRWALVVPQEELEKAESLEQLVGWIPEAVGTRVGLARMVAVAGQSGGGFFPLRSAVRDLLGSWQGLAVILVVPHPLDAARGPGRVADLLESLRRGFQPLTVERLTWPRPSGPDLLRLTDSLCRQLNHRWHPHPPSHPPPPPPPPSPHRAPLRALPGPPSLNKVKAHLFQQPPPFPPKLPHPNHHSFHLNKAMHSLSLSGSGEEGGLGWGIVDTVPLKRGLTEKALLDFFGWVVPLLSAASFAAAPAALCRVGDGLSRESFEGAVVDAKAKGARHIFILFLRWDGPIFGWKKEVEASQSASLQGILLKTVTSRFGTLFPPAPTAAIAAAVASFDQKTLGNLVRWQRREAGLPTDDLVAPVIVRQRQDFAPDRSMALTGGGLQLRFAVLWALRLGVSPEKAGKISPLRIQLQLTSPEDVERLLKAPAPDTAPNVKRVKL